MYKGNIFSFTPAKKFVSLLFHTGAQIPGSLPGLEDGGETARVMRFADVDDIKARGRAAFTGCHLHVEAKK